MSGPDEVRTPPRTARIRIGAAEGVEINYDANTKTGTIDFNRATGINIRTTGNLTPEQQRDVLKFANDNGIDIEGYRDQIAQQADDDTRTITPRTEREETETPAVTKEQQEQHDTALKDSKDNNRYTAAANGELRQGYKDTGDSHKIKDFQRDVLGLKEDATDSKDKADGYWGEGTQGHFEKRLEEYGLPADATPEQLEAAVKKGPPEKKEEEKKETTSAAVTRVQDNANFKSIPNQGVRDSVVARMKDKTEDQQGRMADVASQPTFKDLSENERGLALDFAESEYADRHRFANTMGTSHFTSANQQVKDDIYKILRDDPNKAGRLDELLHRSGTGNSPRNGLTSGELQIELDKIQRERPQPQRRSSDDDVVTV